MENNKDIYKLPEQLKDILESTRELNRKIGDFFEAETERLNFLSTDEVKEKTTTLYDASWKMFDVIGLLGQYVGVLIADNIKGN